MDKVSGYDSANVRRETVRVIPRVTRDRVALEMTRVPLAMTA
jgi:hypothetical protein